MAFMILRNQMYILRTLQVALEIMTLMHLLEDRLRLLHLLRPLVVSKRCVCPTSALFIA